jgi:hypothetical protein
MRTRTGRDIRALFTGRCPWDEVIDVAHITSIPSYREEFMYLTPNEAKVLRGSGWGMRESATGPFVALGGGATAATKRKVALKGIQSVSEFPPFFSS